MMVAMTTKGMAAIYSIRKEAMSKLTKSQIHEARIRRARDCALFPTALAIGLVLTLSFGGALVTALVRFAVTVTPKC